MRPYKGIALTIAGSDSSGGAGIQADLKTFEAFDVYGMSVITALTAQNTFKVSAIFPSSPDFVRAQIDAIFEDIHPDATKTGMLFSKEIIETVAERLSYYKVKNLVIDPVMVAKSGARLLKEDAIEALIEKLLPIALIVTPNLPEAEIIAGLTIKNEEEIIEAGKKILKKGPKWVLMKGGHLEGSSEVPDILISEEKIYKFTGKRVNTKNTHGTGCTISSAITALLASGLEVPDAVCIAKKYIYKAIKDAPDLGHGHGPLRHKVKIKLDLPCVKH